MNKHLPPSNLVEIKIAKPAEQFIILRGYRASSKPFLDEDMMNRAEAISKVAEDQDHLRQIIAFDLEAGTCRDATDDVCGTIIQRWAEDGKLLTEAQKAWVAMCKGEAFANCFRLEMA